MFSNNQLQNYLGVRPNPAFNPDPTATINQAPMNPLDFQSILVIRPAVGPVNFKR